jgi:hypothetical protein
MEILLYLTLNDLPPPAESIAEAPSMCDISSLNYFRSVLKASIDAPLSSKL